MKSRSSERGVASWSLPLTEVESELLLLPSAHQLGQRDSDDKRAAVEHLLDERAEAQKDKACDPGDQEIHGDSRAPGVEAPGRYAGRAQKGCGEGWELIGHTRDRVRRALSARIEHASQGPEETGSHQARDPNAIRVDAAEPRHLTPATEEENASAKRGILEQVPDKSGENDRIVKLEGNAEEAVDDHRIHERRRDAADRHGIAEPKRCAMQEGARAKRDDQRVNTENGDQETVDDADCDPDGERCNHRPADADAV